MFRLVMMALLPVLLSGCAGIQTVSDSQRRSFAEKIDLFATIRIERWGKERFSGILAVAGKEERLVFALLDGTGVTLLEGQVPKEGEEPELSGVLRDSDLADYLYTAFSRIFLLAPQTELCGRSLFQSVCIDVEGETLVRKKFKIGPFTGWSVTYPDDENAPEIVYREPWAGVQITIKEKIM